MTILVTGGAGFIGSHLCEKLLAVGHQVICLDNLSTGHEGNIVHLADNKEFLFIEADVTDLLSQVFKSVKKIDQIYHLACPASPKAYQADPIKTLNTCYNGTLNVLRLAHTHGAKVLFTSTSEVYGDPLVHPQHEGYNGNVNPVGDRSCYDEGKRVSETLCYEFSKHQLVSVARIFNTYGPRLAEGDGRVVSNFIVQALKGLPLTIYGDGSQTRSLCYVDDTVNGLINIMNLGEFGPYNVGTEVELSIHEIAKAIINLTQAKVKIEFKVLPVDDPKQRRPVLTKINALGWQSRVTLSLGLTKTIEYFRGKI